MKSEEELNTIIENIYNAYSNKNENLNFYTLKSFLEDLFSSINMELTDEMKTSIFKLIDKNNDDLIDKQEFKIILRHCFNNA